MFPDVVPDPLGAVRTQDEHQLECAEAAAEGFVVIPLVPPGSYSDPQKLRWKKWAVWTLSAVTILEVAACGSSKSPLTTSTNRSSTQQETTTPNQPLQARVGETLRLVGANPGEKMAVTIVRIIDPAKPSTLNAPV